MASCRSRSELKFNNFKVNSNYAAAADDQGPWKVYWGPALSVARDNKNVNFKSFPGKKKVAQDV